MSTGRAKRLETMARKTASEPMAIWRSTAALLIAAVSASPAGAAEYCVTCEGPPAMYRCIVRDTPEGPGTNSSHSLYCISEMATRGQHEKCAVSRGAPFPCPGLAAEVAQPAGKMAEPPLPDAAPVPASPAPAAEDAAAQPGEKPAPAKVPRTVEELANETVKSSKEGIQKAGEALGGTAKKAGEQIGNAGSAIGNAASQTWTCISSFFSECSGEKTSPPPGGPDEPGAAPPQE